MACQPDGAGAITDLLGRTDTGKYARMTQEIGLIIARRLSFFMFTILTLFFLFRDGLALGKRFHTLSHRLLGQPGEYLATLAVSAVRSTADGLVLVGLGEGALLGVAYVIFGVPHPALLGAFTGLLAMIPFGAPIIFTLASALLFFDGSIGTSGRGVHFRLDRRRDRRSRNPACSDRRRGETAVSLGIARHFRRAGNFRTCRVVSRPRHYGRPGLALARVDRP